MERSWARVAEDLLRAGTGEALEWEGVRLRSVFQPAYSVRRTEVLGYEALVRATAPDGRAIRAERLFREAFARGDGLRLDWACRALHLRSFASIDPGAGRLFLNVHPQAAVGDAELGHEMGELVRYYGMEPQRVVVEIPGDSCLDEVLLREAVDAYRAFGAAIAMEEFGVGRSNLDRIVRLRPDVVKLERSILMEAVGDNKSRRMLPSVVDLLREAGAEVALEGIETADEALVALESGADHVQGYYFATPAASLGEEAIGKALLVRLLRLRASAAGAAGGQAL